MAPDDQAFLDQLNSSRGVFTDFEWTSQRPIADKLADGPLIDDSGGDAVVVRRSDGQPIGVVDWHAVYYGPKKAPHNRVWAVGRELVAGARGQGYGTEVLWLLVDWLFTTTGVNRVEVHTEPDNAASRRSIERVGFTQEGVLRGAVYRAGAFRDLVIYGMDKRQWEVLG
jgi:RimJ/RimL family protein N-acetyltransferase